MWWSFIADITDPLSKLETERVENLSSAAANLICNNLVPYQKIIMSFGQSVSKIHT